MSERLKVEYENYLARYGLKPRRLPPRDEREATLREIVRLQYEEAKSRGDPMADSILPAFEKNLERYLAETRHPATISLERASENVEATIRAVPAFAEKFRDDVCVGEFPTGAINAESVKVDSGFLVLVNSGTMSMLQQVVTFLWQGDADDPGGEKSRRAADGVADVLASYVESGDPFYGPKPVLGGMLGAASGLMSDAAEKFVVAHEYGHILGGHFAEAELASTTLETEVGPLETIRKDHEQEFEADKLGYLLTLGVGAFDQFDLKVIEIAATSDYPGVLHAATRQKCLIAAPFVVLTIDIILGRFSEPVRSQDGEEGPQRTHPSATDRIERLLALRPGADPRYSGFINIPFMLLPFVDRIVKRMRDRVATKERMTPGGNRLLEKAQQSEDIKRCVETIKSGNYSAAALTLADAFEKDCTILEPDVDVVRRELVRAALGQETDIRQKILDRHKSRRGIEKYLQAALNDLPVRAWTSPQERSVSLDRLAEVLPNKPPAALDAVEAALKEVARAESQPADLHLLRAVLSAWRGDRDQVLSSFEAALSAGAADPGGLIAGYVKLERGVLELGVRLDLQELVTAVGVKALGGKGAARELAELVKAYADYLGLTLDPLAQRMIKVQLRGG
jgi:hypothetical protein